MFKKIHDSLKNHVLKNLVQDRFSGVYPFDLNNVPFSKYKSFGEKNPDKVFYVIFREPVGAGFFSNFIHYATYYKYAKSNNFIPIVDAKNFKTLYNEENLINGTANAWEYYFQQVSPYSLEEVYESKHVLFCNGDFPFRLHYAYNDISEYFNEIFRPNQDILESVKRYEQEFQNKRVLGVHFRGKEMNICPNHPFGPTEKQIFKYIDEILEKYDIDKIFISTEEKIYFDNIIKRYGDKVFYTNALRVPKINLYNLNPRKNHRYLLGREILIDLILLLKCNGLLIGASNVTETAKILNTNYEFVYTIHNGINVSNKYKARYLYNIKKRLPKKFGGLLDEVKIITKDKVKV